MFSRSERVKPSRGGDGRRDSVFSLRFPQLMTARVARLHLLPPRIYPDNQLAARISPCRPRADAPSTLPKLRAATVLRGGLRMHPFIRGRT